MILLDIEGIRKHFGPEPVLDGVSFQVRPGERIGLVGPNGCGKTTLLRLLAGAEEPDAGSVARHTSLHLEYLEQQPRFAPGRTLREEAAGRTDEPPKRKRRLSYRKVADIEEEIFRREAAVEGLHRRLAAGETHRDGDLVRRIKAEIAAERAALETLYAHWEEATELNW